MIRVLIFIAVVVAVILASQTSTLAEPARRMTCGDRTTLIEQLLKRYGEVPVSMGLDAVGHVLEVLAAPSGTWSILVSTPYGLTCLAASGVAWEDVAPAQDTAGQEH